MTFAAVGAIGSAVGGIGSAIGSAVTTVGGGSFGAGAATLGGLGLSAFNAFSSGTSISPSATIKLDAKDQGLFNKVHGEYKDWRQMATRGQFFPNLATPVLQELRKQAQTSYKQTASGMRAAAAQKNTEGYTASGKQVGMGLLGFGLNYQAGTAESKATGEMQREQFLGVLKQGQNFQNIEKQVPLLNAQVQYAKSAQTQMNSIAQGQFLGGLAELGGMMYYNKKTGGKLLPF